MEYTVTGNKKLVFHLYVFDGFEENVFTRLHRNCLKKVIGNFDDAIFSIAVDDLNDYVKIKSGISFVKDVCDGVVSYDIVIIKNDKELREVTTFKQICLPLIEKGSDECVFFAHNKGCSRFYGRDDSVLRWCMIMYCYCFENLTELYENFQNGKAFYGSVLQARDGGTNPYSLMRYSSYYPGTFYWMNIRKIKELIGEYTGVLFLLVNGRYSAEEFPDFFEDNLISSYKGIVLKNIPQHHDMYLMDRNMWIEYIKTYFDEGAKIISFMDNVMAEII